MPGKVWEEITYPFHIFNGCLFGAKPLSKPKLGYCRLDPNEQTSVKYLSKYKTFHSRKCIWKCRLWNGGYFAQGSWVELPSKAHPSDKYGWQLLINVRWPWRDIITWCFQLHEKILTCAKKILCLCIHEYLACIHNYRACIHNYLACVHK